MLQRAGIIRKLLIIQVFIRYVSSGGFEEVVNQRIFNSTHRKCHKNVHLKSLYNMHVFSLSEYKHPHRPPSLYSANITSLQIKHFRSEYLQCNKMKRFCNVETTSKPISTLLRWQPHLSHHALGLSVSGKTLLKRQTQTVWTILIKAIELVYILCWISVVWFVLVFYRI